MKKVLVVGVALLAMLGGLLATMQQPAGAQEATVMTKVRLAHLSPDTPAMDIYAAGADGIETKVLSSLAYRDVSEYVGLPVGFYAFKMRPAGAPTGSTAALSATALLEGSEAFTLAAFGPSAEIQTQLIRDDLRSPGSRKTAVRVFQAAPALGTVSVKVAGGPDLYSDLPVGEATGYSDVASGTRTMVVTPDDPAVPAVEAAIELPAGGVVTLIVGGKSGSMAMMAVIDASGTDLSASGASTSVAPTGGVAAGGGGLAGFAGFESAATSGTSGTTMAAVLASGLFMTAALTSVTVARRRSTVRH